MVLVPSYLFILTDSFSVPWPISHSKYLGHLDIQGRNKSIICLCWKCNATYVTVSLHPSEILTVPDTPRTSCRKLPLQQMLISPQPGHKLTDRVQLLSQGKVVSHWPSVHEGPTPNLCPTPSALNQVPLDTIS